MSSPIAKDSHTDAEQRLISLHQKASHKHRVALLADIVAQRIDPDADSLCLDIGCGGMEISGLVQALRPKLEVKGLDLYPETRLTTKGLDWRNYQQFNGLELPFPDKAAGYALFIDALHHMSSEVRAKMLAEAVRVAAKVIIKDHFEYGLVSRTMLRAMDFIGNWAYGVSIPKSYLTTIAFNELVANAGGVVREISIGIDLYDHLPGVRWLANPKWQFVAIVESADRNG